MWMEATHRPNSYIGSRLIRVGRTCIRRTMWMRFWSSDICRAFDQATQVPITGPPTLSMFSGKLRADLLFLDHATALRATEVPSSRARQSGAPFSFRHARKTHRCAMRSALHGLGFSGSPSVSGGMRSVNGRMKFGRTSARGVGLRSNFKERVRFPWILERRNGLARGTYNRLAADDRFTGEQLLFEESLCLNTLISGGGNAAHRIVFGSNPVDLFGWDSKDEDSVFAQETSSVGPICTAMEVAINGARIRPQASGEQHTATPIVVQ